jgi:methionyl aminopeptidase
MVILKNSTDIRYLREAGKIAGACCEELIQAAQPGVSTVELETLANRLLSQSRSSAPFKQFEGFGHAICVSINDEIVNGPPSRERTLKDGDVVSIAIGSEYRGLYCKAARTNYLGSAPSEDIQRLLTGTAAIFNEIKNSAQTFETLYDLLTLVPKFANDYDLRIIQESGGYCIGKKLHDLPFIPNQPTEHEKQIALMPGFAFTLMPMMTLDSTGEYTIHEDGWTQVTKDDGLSAHVADTILVTEQGLELLSHNI